jgi:hypothetical protein
MNHHLSANLHDVMEHSFKDYHVKGFDYLCLKRTPEETLKVYMFRDIDPRKFDMHGEVVCPHDHRYDFRTRVLAGSVHNRIYRDVVLPSSPLDVRYNRFIYQTPLNGGSGFQRVGSTYLREIYCSEYTSKSNAYSMDAEQLHTIRVSSPDTVLLLSQGPDQDLGHTLTFSLEDRMPSLSGLYSKFTVDEVIERCKWLRQLGIVVALKA